MKVGKEIILAKQNASVNFRRKSFGEGSDWVNVKENGEDEDEGEGEREVGRFAQETNEPEISKMLGNFFAGDVS